MVEVGGAVGVVPERREEEKGSSSSEKSPFGRPFFFCWATSLSVGLQRSWVYDEGISDGTDCSLHTYNVYIIHTHTKSIAL